MCMKDVVPNVEQQTSCFCLIGPHQCRATLGGPATSTVDTKQCSIYAHNYESTAGFSSTIIPDAVQIFQICRIDDSQTHNRACI